MTVYSADWCSFLFGFYGSAKPKVLKRTQSSSKFKQYSCW